MAEADVNKESDIESSLELEIRSNGTMRLFMFEPQHGTSSEEEVDSHGSRSTRNGGIRRTIAFWQSRLIAKFSMPTEMWLLPENGCSEGPFGPRR